LQLEASFQAARKRNQDIVANLHALAASNPADECMAPATEASLGLKSARAAYLKVAVASRDQWAEGAAARLEEKKRTLEALEAARRAEAAKRDEAVKVRRGLCGWWLRSLD
jgi:hypothetical protein